MAVTSLWHIKGNLKDLIDYVENPDKTVPKGTEDFFQCVFLCAESCINGKERICFRRQLPERNRTSADDTGKKAIRQRR